MRVLLVGCGKMGGYHLNAIRRFGTVETVSIVEPNELTKELLDTETRFPTLDECLRAKQHDLAVIASPTVTHVEIARKLLSNGIKTLIEKPISTSIGEALRLERFSSMLAIGHVERFNPVVEVLLDIIRDRRVDSCNFIRLSGLPSRIADVGVDLDLSIHDLDLVMYMLGHARVLDRTKVMGDGGRVIDAKYSLKCEETSISIHSSWLYEKPDRRIVVESEGDLLVGDLIAKTVTVNDVPIEFETEGPDQLTKQFDAFLKFVSGERTKVCSYAEAVSVLGMV